MVDYLRPPRPDPLTAQQFGVNQLRDMSVTVVRAATPVRKMKTDANDEIFILVVGQSGVGKSSFINAVSNSTLRISSGLESSTEKVETSLPFYIDGQCIRLVDTPGFDDSSRSDTDILNTIASYLASEYANGQKLSGVICLHSIAATRIGGVVRRNLTMLARLCGRRALPNVAIVTTRWDQVRSKTGEARENQLCTKSTFFKSLIDMGATIFRYNRSQNHLSTAQDIVRHFLKRSPIPLLIQREMVDGGKLVSETTAGQELQRDFRKQLEDHQKNMRQLKNEYEQVKGDHDVASAKKIRDEMITIKETAEKLKDESKKLASIKPFSQPLRLLISNTSPIAEINTNKQDQGQRPSAMRSSPFNFAAVPPLASTIVPTIRNTTSADKGKGKAPEVPPLPIEPPSVAADRIPHPRKRRSSHHHHHDHGRHSRTRLRAGRSTTKDAFVNLESWEIFLMVAVLFLVLVPVIRKLQSIE